MRKEKDSPVEFDMDAVIQKMKEYCSQKGYNLNKIDRYDCAWDIAAALQNSGVEPDGLCNDMETMPYCVLYYDANGVIHETEHTWRIAEKNMQPRSEK